MTMFVHTCKYMLIFHLDLIKQRFKGQGLINNNVGSHGDQTIMATNIGTYLYLLYRVIFQQLGFSAIKICMIYFILYFYWVCLPG